MPPFPVDLCFGGKSQSSALDLFAGWQDVAQQTRVQKTLELQLSQREDAETQLSSGRKETQRLQVPLKKQGSDWVAWWYQLCTLIRIRIFN